MRRLVLVFAAVAAVAAVSVASPAEAAIIAEDFSFTATAPGPVASHSGTFTLNFDDVANIYTLVSLSYTSLPTDFTEANSALYTSPAVPLSPGVYLISGSPNGPFLGPGLDDFSFTFDPALSTGFTFGYTAFGIGPVTATSFTLTRTNGAVPEPATWAMVLLGFAGIGVAMRRKRRVAAVA